MDSFIGMNYRMNEMTGVSWARSAQARYHPGAAAAQFARDSHRIRDLRIEARRIPDPEGEIGLASICCYPPKSCAKNLSRPCVRNARRRASGSLTSQRAVHRAESRHASAWPTFNTPHGKAMRYARAAVRVPPPSSIASPSFHRVRDSRRSRTVAGAIESAAG